MINIHRVVAQLKQAGFKVQSFTTDNDWQFGCDDEIVITDLTSIQVGSHYMLVSQWTSPAHEKLKHYTPREKIDALIRDLTKALQEENI